MISCFCVLLCCCCGFLWFNGLLGCFRRLQNISHNVALLLLLSFVCYCVDVIAICCFVRVVVVTVICWVLNVVIVVDYCCTLVRY